MLEWFMSLPSNVQLGLGVFTTVFVIACLALFSIIINEIASRLEKDRPYFGSNAEKFRWAFYTLAYGWGLYKYFQEFLPQAIEMYYGNLLWVEWVDWAVYVIPTTIILAVTMRFFTAILWFLLAYGWLFLSRLNHSL